MADDFSPPPIRSTIGLNNGQIATIWAKWFQNLYNKVGGASAPSITEINNTIVTQSAELSAAQNAIADLQVESAFEQGKCALLYSKINEISINNAFNESHRMAQTEINEIAISNAFGSTQRITQTTNLYDY